MNVKLTNEIINLIAIGIGVLIVIFSSKPVKYPWLPTLRNYFLAVSILDILYFVSYKYFYFSVNLTYLSYTYLFISPVFIYLLPNGLVPNPGIDKVVRLLLLGLLAFIIYRTAFNWGGYDVLSWLAMQLVTSLALLIKLYVLAKQFSKPAERKSLFYIYVAFLMMFIVPVITNPFQVILSSSTSFVYQCAFILLNSVAAIAYLVILYQVIRIPRSLTASPTPLPPLRGQS